jgi:hypothetical protein
MGEAFAEEDADTAPQLANAQSEAVCLREQAVTC